MKHTRFCHQKNHALNHFCSSYAACLCFCFMERMTNPIKIINTPNQPDAFKYSPTTTTLNIAAVNGSASAMVVADDEVTFFNPTEYNTYPIAVVTTPIYNILNIPVFVRMPLLSKKNMKGSNIIALMVKTTATVLRAPFSSTMRLLFNV